MGAPVDRVQPRQRVDHVGSEGRPLGIGERPAPVRARHGNRHFTGQPLHDVEGTLEDRRISLEPGRTRRRDRIG
jgi:hypothetical protein